MDNITLPEDCAKQWEILLLLLSSEEKKIDRTCENEVDTMHYFLKAEGLRKILLQWLYQMKAAYAKKISDQDTAIKCDSVSLHWRQTGNDKFRANLVKESYKCYNNSVLYADQKGPMYPLALANRSAALFRMKRFQECLLDIQLAIKYGYPIGQRHKLYLRRADCHIELLERREAEIALAETIQHANSLDLSATHSLELEKHIKILEKKLESLDTATKQENQFELPQCHMGINPAFNSASIAIDLRRNDTMGRHVIAKENIKRGDVLFSEEPYAWVTLPLEEAICEMCCQTEINLVPCSQCSRSVYCGEECRTTAQSFHRWECDGAQFALFPTIGIAHLALRLRHACPCVRKGLPQPPNVPLSQNKPNSPPPQPAPTGVLLLSVHNGFPQVPTHCKEPKIALDLFKSYSEVDNIEIYKTDAQPFYRMFNLVTNFENMNNTDYIQYALTATMLTLYLENFTTFFDFLPSKVPYTLKSEQLRLFAAAIILRSLGQLVCNGHAALSLCTVEEDDSDGRTLTEREVRRATAIYPSAAMMNHSCDPNIINTFYKRRLIIRCARDVDSGGEVFNCYGPHRARATVQQRRRQLRTQYMFHCSCTACRDTEQSDFVLLFSAYSCQSCKGPVTWQSRRSCHQCRAEFHPERALAVIECAEELALQAERASSMEDKCDRMQASYKLKQQVWHRHHSSLRDAADKLARLYADNGEFSKSVELIKQNIQSLEYQFGSFSVEVAHELRKLTEVMLERLYNSPQNPDYRDWCLEAHKIIKKAIQLMELNYGSWEPLVARLKEQELLIANFLADSTTSDGVDCVHHNLHYNLKI